MSCPHYVFRSNDYYCSQLEDYVDSDTYYRFCRNYDYSDCPHFESGSSSTCFLTSACVRAKGLPDDCMELTTLRAYRDNWCRSQPGGEAEITEYYRIAPTIVKSINASPSANEIWEQVYQTMVLPCVQLIQSGKNEEALDLYRSKTLELRELYYSL